MTLKAAIKHAVYHSGALTAWRRSRPGALTVILMHRVLPDDDPRSDTADPNYTLRLETFERCLDALRRWYQPVSLEEVEGALRQRTELPANALLVTFDDGWEDTARYAVPALRARGIPAVVFVTTGAVGNEHTPWRDVAACAWRAGTLRAPGERGDGALDGVLQWLETLPEDERNRQLGRAVSEAGQSVRPLMITAEEMQRLAREGVGLGGHGVSHTPLTKLADAEGELSRCRDEFHRLTGSWPSSFAFPHGLYTARELTAAQRSGFKLIFTSDRHLNPLQRGCPKSSVFGRVAIAEESITDSEGRFVAEKLAFWLTLQPVHAI